MKDIQLFGTGLHASSFVIAPENRVNCYYELRKDESGGGRIILRGTPGSVALWSVPLGPIRGWRVVGSILYVVSAQFLFTVTTAGVATKVATLPTSTGRVGMADVYTQLCIVDGTGGYTYTIAGGAFTTIVDANFPNGATTVTSLSSRFIVEKPNTREFYMSAILDGTTWSYLTLAIYATKEQYSDPMMAVDAFNGTLILWGTKSIEFWQDVGTSPNPFAKVVGSTQSYGLAAKYSRAVVNSEVYFLGVGAQGGYTIFSFSGYQPKRISTPDVEEVLANLAITYSLSDAVALTYSVFGHDMYQLTFPTANISLLYSVDSGIWSFVQTGAAKGRHFADTSIQFNNVTLFNDTTTGTIYQITPTAYDDSGRTVFRQVITKCIRSGDMEFAISELHLMMDTGSVPQAANYSISIEVSKDGGRTYGSPRARTLGLVGQYRNPKVKWLRLGSAKEFVLRITLTDPVPFIIAGSSIETTVG